MRKLLKFFFGLVIIIGIVMVLSSFLLVKVVDQESIKTKISQVVHDKTGRQLNINGNINWSFFPWLGVKVKDVTLSNMLDFKNSKFAEVGEIDVKVKLLPLFFRKVEISHLSLKNFNLWLIKNNYGESNWQDLMNFTSAKPATQTDKAPISDLLIGSLDIDNGHVILQDLQTNQAIDVSELNLTSKNFIFGNVFPVKFNCKFNNLQTNLNGVVALSAKVLLDSVAQKYSIQNLQLTGKLQGAQLQQPLTFSATTVINFDFKKQVLTAENINIKIADAVIIGNLQAINVIDAPNVIGKFIVNNFNATNLLRNLGLTPKSSLWQNVALKVSFETTSKFLKMPVIEVQIGDSLLQGSANYSHFSDKLVIFNFRLNKFLADIFDFASVPIVAHSQSKTQLANSTRQPAESNFAYDILRAIKLNGDLKIAAVKASNLNLSNFSLQVDGDHGQINFPQLRFNAYNGTAQGTLNIDVRSNLPAISSHLVLSDVALQPLLNSIGNFNKVTGNFSSDININTRGESVAALTRNLNGMTKVTLQKGSYLGFDVPYQIRKVSAMVNKRAAPQETNPPHTDFDKLTANFRVNSGVLSTNDLLIQAADYKVTGEGTINLVAQTIAMLLKGNAVGEPDYIIPIHVTGALLSPSFRPDVAIILQHAVEKAVGQQLQKQLDKNLGGKEGEIAKSLLQSLPLDKILN